MRSCPPVDSLAHFLASHLSEPERTQVEDHVENCIACQDNLNRLVLTAPGPDPNQLLSALADVTIPHATAEAAEFIEKVKQRVLGNGVYSQASETFRVGEFGTRPEVAGYEVLEELGRGASGVIFRRTIASWTDSSR